MIKNIVESYQHIPYTTKHYFAFMVTQKQILGRYQYFFHDVDKLLMYIFLPFLGVKKISKIHKKINKHHITNNKRPSECNYVEAILDWESARYTKPDKPLSAREFIKTGKFSRSGHLFHLYVALHKLGL